MRKAQDDAERDLVLAWHTAALNCEATWGKKGIRPLKKLLERVRPKERLLAEKRRTERAGWHMIAQLFKIPIKRRKKRKPSTEGSAHG